MAAALRCVLGRMLITAGAATEQTVNAALAEQRQTRERLGVILTRQGVPAESVAHALAAQLRLPYAPAPLAPEPAASALIDAPLAARLRAVPLRIVEGVLHVAMADPLDHGALDDLQFRSGHRVQPVVATVAAIDAALASADQDTTVAALVTRLHGPPRAPPPDAAAEEIGALRRASESPPVVALVDLVIGRAASRQASDIHLEPTQDDVRVRVRVDGTLRELLRLPSSAMAGVVSRIKIMADLDIAERRRPQDGRAALPLADGSIGARVSTLPTQYGEKVVLRLLDTRAAVRPLTALGIDTDALERITMMLAHSHGLILVTGPTGSGKTTTLYAALTALDREQRNIVTLEDPVEYRLPGLTQVQIRPKAGLDFASALRAVLRQDPDVIMVGELRDRETARIALAAAMTGHLVLATLHTNDAPSAATRLTEMGVPPYLTAGTLVGVVAQRLVRRLCAACRRQRPLRPAEAAAWIAAATPAHGGAAAPGLVYDATGCARCDGHGFAGRAGIFEVLMPGARARRLLLRRASADALRRTCIAEGMVGLAMAACRKVADGTTTMAEARPFLIADAVPLRKCAACGALGTAGQSFCPGCGHRDERRCPCGAKLAAAWRHCARCGAGRAAASPTATPGTRPVAGTGTMR